MAFVSSLPLRFVVTNTTRSCSSSTTLPTPLSTPYSQTRLRLLRERPVYHLQRQRRLATTMVLSEGQKAPSFSATDTDGNTVALDDFRGNKLVLYFSNASGPGCVSQSCSFRDAEAQFSALDAKIVAVSAQNQGASTQFKQSNGLSFPVIPDKDGRLQKLYAVPATLGLIPGRITYVIDRDGVIRSVYNSQFSVSSHIDVAKDALKKMQ